jgi:hypothetical protein
MKIIYPLTHLLLFSITLLSENFLNLIIFSKYISISPFFILLIIFSLTRFRNINIFPIMGSGLLYDIFLSENYLGVYAIIFLLTSVSINYMNEKLIEFNFKLFFIFTLNYVIYNILNISSLDVLLIFPLSLFINYFLFILIKRAMRLSV